MRFFWELETCVLRPRLFGLRPRHSTGLATALPNQVRPMHAAQTEGLEANRHAAASTLVVVVSLTLTEPKASFETLTAHIDLAQARSQIRVILRNNRLIYEDMLLD